MAAERAECEWRKEQRMRRGILALAGLSLAYFSYIHSGFAEETPGVVKVDGSSTVYPITEAVAEEFLSAHPRTKVTVGVAGTGGGFKKFLAGEVDIVNASRPIKQSEREGAEKAGITFVELPVAFDALSVVVNPSNSWVKSLTVADLVRMWAPEAQGKVMTWKDVRPEWPAEKLQLFGPGTDSGTFDYFTEAIVGKEKASRGDYTGSEDDNLLVQGVSGNKGGLGYLGLAYYFANKDRLKLVPVDDEKGENGSGPILPSVDTVRDGTYRPLSRPLFIYVRAAALDRPEVKAFAEFYLANVQKLAEEVGYVALPGDLMGLIVKRLAEKKVGSAFASGSAHAGSIAQLFSSETK
jgi:phosphate transport system substrate-binding protein